MQPNAQPTARPSAADRLLSFLGFARGVPERALAEHTSAIPDSPAETHPGTVIKQPRILGEPIQQQSGTEYQLGQSLYTTQPQVSADGGSCGPLTVRAASVIGRLHAHNGLTREDAFAIRHAPDGTVIVAAADGVGSHTARFSAVGAQLASLLSCDHVCLQLAKRHPIEPTVMAAQLGTEMMKAAARMIIGPYDQHSLATTLTTAWVSPDGSYSAFVIGDGTVFELTSRRMSVVLSGDGGGMGDTDALPSAYSRVHEVSGRLAPGSALLLATDGLADPMHSAEVAGALAQAWLEPPTILDFLADISFERRGEADDRTAVCVWHKPEPVGR